MLYLTLMFIGFIIMLQTGALGALNECLIPALSEMWGDSKLDVLLFTLIGHDEDAEQVGDRLEYAAFDAAAPQREAQWVRDLIEAVEATTPRIIGVSVGQFLAGSVLDNRDDLRAHSAPLLGEVEVPEGVLVERFIPVPSPAPLHKTEVDRLVNQEPVWLLRQLARLTVLRHQSRALLHSFLPTPRKRRRGMRVRY